jgi:hypothetical protein
MDNKTPTITNVDITNAIHEIQADEGEIPQSIEDLSKSPYIQHRADITMMLGLLFSPHNAIAVSIAIGVAAGVRIGRKQVLGEILEAQSQATERIRNSIAHAQPDAKHPWDTLQTNQKSGYTQDDKNKEPQK